MRRMLLLLPLLCLATPAAADGVKVENVWSRAAQKGQVGVLYFTVVNGDSADRLEGAEAAIADKVELHESLNDGGVMKMRAVAGVALAPGQTLALKPGGYHVMLIGLHQAVAAGDSFPVTIRFDHAGAVNAIAKVAKAGALAPDDHAAMAPMMNHSEMKH